MKRASFDWLQARASFDWLQARASFDWLQEEGGPAPPPHACKTQRVRESCQNCKRREKKDGAVHIGLFLEMYTSHLDIWHSLFLHIQIGSTQSIHFVVLLNCCFRLQITVHRLAVLLTLFWRKKTCQKCKHGEMEGGRIQIIFILR